MMKIGYLFLMSFLLIGCQSSNVEVIPQHSQYMAVEVVSNQQSQKEMTVRERVKGNDIYVECIVSDFKFSTRKNKDDGDGFIKLYLNNKKIDEIYSAAFIIKGVPTGTHEIKLELVSNEGKPLGIEDTFEVSL